MSSKIVTLYWQPHFGQVSLFLRIGWQVLSLKMYM